MEEEESVGRGKRERMSGKEEEIEGKKMEEGINLKSEAIGEAQRMGGRRKGKSEASERRNKFQQRETKGEERVRGSGRNGNANQEMQ